MWCYKHKVYVMLIRQHYSSCVFLSIDKEIPIEKLKLVQHHRISTCTSMTSYLTSWTQWLIQWVIFASVMQLFWPIRSAFEICNHKVMGMTPIMSLLSSGLDHVVECSDALFSDLYFDADGWVTTGKAASLQTRDIYPFTFRSTGWRKPRKQLTDWGFLENVR